MAGTGHVLHHRPCAVAGRTRCRLSAAQVYRLVAQTPERLHLRTLAALCDILECTPNDLIEPVVETGKQKATGTGDVAARRDEPARGRTPRRTEVRRQP